MAQNTKLPAIDEYRNHLRHVLLPMILRIRKPTDILPNAKAMIAKG